MSSIKLHNQYAATNGRKPRRQLVDQLTTVPRPTHKWKVVVQTPKQKLCVPSDKAVENGGIRWKQIVPK
ncbi:hypothetical protein D8674_028313 [Pyrus ussuriensis x Pyrus communis]|uniref:Uncharacterized protein n=1 Tax=Pyrus ussuriensis x Pyrus communis TaxID=2448454 RepID=A0A5N5HVU9_9ROSA|nr:hypothetical protein D8674_028313 [Pyrus ussuriensis x Pyrus communis]